MAVKNKDKKVLYYLVRAGADLDAKIFSDSRNFWEHIDKHGFMELKEIAKKSVRDRFRDRITYKSSSENQKSLRM